MDTPISATFIRPTQSLNHILIKYQVNIFSTNMIYAYVRNSDFFKDFEAGKEFKLPANPRPVFRFKENGDRYEYSDGEPQLYLEW